MPSESNKNNYLPYALSAASGLAICLAVVLVTGKKEAWDTGAYFSIAIPVMCLIIFAISYRYTEKPWRWTVSMALGQSIAIVLGGGSASLWPLSIVAMLVVSIPQFIAGALAVRLRKRMDGV